MKFADLHIHTHFSDSTDSPQEVVQAARDQQLSCIAITDHDSVDGVQPTADIAAAFDLEVITGIELSTEIQKRDVHILGYCFDPKNPFLVERLTQFQDTRVERIKKMISKLEKLGINNIAADEVCALTRSKSVGRPHLATMLLEKGWIKSIGEAFNKYLGEGCAAYVPKFQQTPYEGIELIRQAGGVAVMAHPMITNKDELIPSLVEAGMQGIEVYYPNCPENIVHYYEGIAKKHNLAMTGGSDAHGKAKHNTFVGKRRIPYELVEKLKQSAGR